MFRSIILMMLSLLILNVFVVSNAAAWTSWGIAYGAGYLPVTINAHNAGTPDCTGEYAAFRRAFRTWIEVQGSSFTAVAGNLVTYKASPDYNEVLAFDYGFQSGVLGVCTRWKNGPNRECDIEFNENERWNCSGYCMPPEIDLETVCLHEGGHLLGLGHSTQPLAVMYAYYSTTKRDLHSDDINGISSLY